MIKAADWVVLVLAGAFVSGLYLHLWGGPSAAAETAEIMLGDDPFASVDLARNQQISVAGPHGHSVLQVEDGRIRFVESPCRNKVCLRAGWLEHAGDAAACLPNRVSVALTGGDSPYDSLNY